MTMKATNDTAAAQNMPVIIGEFHANAWPPRLRATIKKERVDISMIIPARSSFARLARKPLLCEGGGGKRSALSRTSVTDDHDVRAMISKDNEATH